MQRVVEKEVTCFACTLYVTEYLLLILLSGMVNYMCGMQRCHSMWLTLRWRLPPVHVPVHRVLHVTCRSMLCCPSSNGSVTLIRA